MTREEALMLSAYTGVLLVPDFEDVHRYCEELMGFPILTHEFAGERLQSEIREKLRPRVWALCQAAADNSSGGREQVEKVWKGEWRDLHGDKLVGIDDAGQDVYRHYHYSVCKKCGKGIAAKSNFCPYCGDAKTDEAVDMVMERLEALRGETETD